jgi:hypothetical protein
MSVVEPTQQWYAEKRADHCADRCSNPQRHRCGNRGSLREKVDRDSCSVHQECGGGCRRHQLARPKLEPKQCRGPDPTLIADHATEDSRESATQDSPEPGLGERNPPLQELTEAGDYEQRCEDDG